MTIDIDNVRLCLREFRFENLLLDELGWKPPTLNNAVEIDTVLGYEYKSIAELDGLVIFKVFGQTQRLPNQKERNQIWNKLTQKARDLVIVFESNTKLESLWKFGSTTKEAYFAKVQAPDHFLMNLANFLQEVGIGHGKSRIIESGGRIRGMLDYEKAAKAFFKRYDIFFPTFEESIQGIPDQSKRRIFATVLLNRMMFIFFLQKKGFLDEGNTTYLGDKLEETCSRVGSNKFYVSFLKLLFFEGFAKPIEERSYDTKKIIGSITFLNGGMFLAHSIEYDFGNAIEIPDTSFEALFSMFEEFSWTFNEGFGGAENEINPDILGYIFEKYINQKSYGAYYTRKEITQYLCEQTIFPAILDAANLAFKEAGSKTQFFGMSDLLLNLDDFLCQKLIFGDDAILPKLTILDPACGSGAFLVAALKTLISVYSVVLGKIPFLEGESKLKDWFKEIELTHNNLAYFVKHGILTNNLFGVDIMEEAVEIAKLRLFLSLVASADMAEHLKPLPNLDFNLMPGNSLVGITAKDAKSLEKKSHLDLESQETGLSYENRLKEKESLIKSFKAPKKGENLLQLKNEINGLRERDRPYLNQVLISDFLRKKIKYPRQQYVPNKRTYQKHVREVSIDDLVGLSPFHWQYEFPLELSAARSGFDVIVTNPPWEVLKPNAKEFFSFYSKGISKKKMSNIEFEKIQYRILDEDEGIREKWNSYLTSYYFMNAFFARHDHFENQISIVNSKKAGTDINLYKLFTEQCYNLLRPGGYCGIIIPSGIYTDLGSKQLREMLFERCRILQLVALSNEKFLFEGVHHSFKFCLLSFQKGGKTEDFKATFRINPRESVGKDDLYGFLHAPSNFVTLSTAFIRRQSPDSLSVMEVREPMDYSIAEKMMKFPALGDKVDGSFHYSLHREFDMTMDSALFQVEQKAHMFPLFEGKMIHQFTSEFAKPRYWVDEEAGRKSILGRTPDTGQVLDYQRYRISHRAIARSTDIRTMIASVLPKHCFYGHSLNATKGEMDEADLLVLVSFLNSFCLDFALRQSVSANLTMFFIYQLPMPRLSRSDKWHHAILTRAAKLVCTTGAYADLWEAVMPTKWSEKEVATQEHERNTLRAELDGIIAHIYGLTEAEFMYILKSFPVVPQPQIIKTENAYRDVVHGLIKP